MVELVGVDVADLGEPNEHPPPTGKPQELGDDFALLSCNCLKDASTSFTDPPNGARRSDGALGDIGGESDGGDKGGEVRVEVGDEEKMFLGK